MKALLRRGMCPTLAAPIATGDGLLARLNPVEAGLSAAQLIGLCEAAARHGNGLIEITARGNLQIRGLTAQTTPRLAAEVDALGIAVRTGVPVETPPLAGLDPDEIADPRPLAARIREAIAAAGLEGRLGPKVSIVVDGAGRSGMDAVASDIRLTAMRSAAPGDIVRWKLAVDGDVRGAIVLGAVNDVDASDTAISLLQEIAAFGREGRARNLTFELLPARLSRIPSFAHLRAPPNYGETDMPVGTILPVTDARVALPVALPFGSIHANDLAAFVAKADANGIAEFRLAPQRKLILLAESKADAQAAKALAAQAGLIVEPSDPRAHIAACAGAPACASGHIPARRMAAEIAAALPPGTAIDLHVSGCEKRCARPGHAGLTLVGTPDGIDCLRESAGRSPFATLPHGSATAEWLAAIFAEGTR